MKNSEIYKILKDLNYPKFLFEEKKIKLRDNKDSKKIKFCIGGNCNVDFLKPSINTYFSKLNYKVEILSLDYNNWQSAVYQNIIKPDWWIIWLSSIGFSEGITKRPKIDQKEIISSIKKILDNGENVILILPEKMIIENNQFNLFFKWRNDLLNSFLEKIPNRALYLIPDNISNIENFNKNALRYWSIAKIPFHPDYVSRIGVEICNTISNSIKRELKAIAVDLDDTLWGGVVGDVGYENIVLDKNSNGRAFLEMQLFLKDQIEKGIPLFVVSKNNIKVVNSVFKKRKEMIIKKKDVLEFFVNWEPKYLSIKKIAKRLNISIENICFIDDSSFERNQTQTFLPNLIIPEISNDPELRVEELVMTGLFNLHTSNKEDSKKVKMFKQELKRSITKLEFRDLNQYLKSLSMKLEISVINKANLSRVRSLLDKTNQFNLTNYRTSNTEIIELLKNHNNYLYVGNLYDKFGESGIIYAIICKRKENKLQILDWVMSCRVFGRNVEFEALNHLISWSLKNNVDIVESVFVSTKKNIYLEKILKKLQFKNKKNNIIIEAKVYKNYYSQIKINEKN